MTLFSTASASGSLAIPLVQPNSDAGSSNKFEDQLRQFTEYRGGVTYSTKFIVWTSLLGLASAAIFFFSAQKASVYYVDLLSEQNQGASFIFEWFAPLCVAITNSIFNAEAFIALWGKIEGLLPAFLAYCHYIFTHPMTETNAWLVSAATILPFWYVSINDPAALFVPESISSFLCLFVFYDGAEEFMKIMSYPLMQQLRFTIEFFVLDLCKSIADLCNFSNLSENLQNLMDQRTAWLELVRVKTLLVNALEEVNYAYCYSSSANRNRFVEELKGNQQPLLSSLLTYPDALQVENGRITNPISQSRVLQFIKYGLFAFFAMEQNFGHGVESYKAGAQIHPMLGVVLALLNLVPSLGFTISGILGYGPVEMCLEITGYRRSAMQQIAPTQYNWIWLMRFSSLFSGFSNNALNLIGAKDCGASPLLAFYVGLIANIGTVFGFNNPKCELWYQRSVMEKVLPETYRSQIVVQQNLRQLLSDIKTASPQEIDELRYNEYCKNSITLFLNEKNANIQLRSRHLKAPTAL